LLEAELVMVGCVKFEITQWGDALIITADKVIHNIIKLDEVLFGNDDMKASLIISDHSPLCVELDTSVGDD
jgi:hypothetical protein